VPGEASVVDADRMRDAALASLVMNARIVSEAQHNFNAKMLRQLLARGMKE
jgi:hypothetical protein